MFDINSRMDAWAKSNRAQSSQEVESFLRDASGEVDHLSDPPKGMTAETINNNSLSDGQTWDRRRAKGAPTTEEATAEGRKNPLFGRVKEAFRSFRDKISARKDLKAANRLHDHGYRVEGDSRDIGDLYRYQKYQKSNPFDIDARVVAWSMNDLKDSETEVLLKSTSSQTFFKKSAMCQEMIDTMSEDELGEALISAIEELLGRTGVDAE